MYISFHLITLPFVLVRECRVLVASCVVGQLLQPVQPQPRPPPIPSPPALPASKGTDPLRRNVLIVRCPVWESHFSGLTQQVGLCRFHGFHGYQVSCSPKFSRVGGGVMFPELFSKPSDGHPQCLCTASCFAMGVHLSNDDIIIFHLPHSVN